MDRKTYERENRLRIRKKQIMVHCSIFVIAILLAAGVLMAGYQVVKEPKVVVGSAQVPKEVTKVQSKAKEELQEQKVIKDTAIKKELTQSHESKYPVPGWQIDDSGWWYQDTKESYFVGGWKNIKGIPYYFDESGYMATGYRIIDGVDYYFNDSGQVDEDPNPKLIALTFDDGPSKHTSKLLDTLEANHAKATFFMVGRQVDYFQAEVKRMHALGMEIGNHTWDHTYLKNATPQIMYQKFDQLDQKLLELIGVESTLYRTPGGGETDAYRVGAKKPLIMWSLDTLDWKTLDANANVSAVLDHVKDGDIVLLHDLHAPTVEACDVIIPELRKRGFKLVTVSELAKARGVTLNAGIDYFSMKAEEGNQAPAEALKE